MKPTAGPSASASVVLLVVLSTVLGIPRVGMAQNPLPNYQRLFEDPPRTDLLTPADLPNLGRLVVLEATSMFVHARSELANSPNAFRMLDEIRNLWSAADAFTAAVADDPTSPLAIEAGRLSFGDLEAAFAQVRDSFAVLPGGAPLAGRNLMNTTRVVAVIGPLLRQGESQTSAARPRVLRTGPAVRAAADEIAGTVAALKRQIDAAPGQKAVSRNELDKELLGLMQLVEGLGRIARGATGVADLSASLRPIRSQVQRLDVELQKAGLSRVTRNDEWRAIRQRVDALADRLQLPREIVPPRPSAPRPAAPLLEQLDRAASGAGRLAEDARAAGEALDHRLVAADASRLRHRLDLLRQALVGREPAASVTQALRGVEQALRQLGEAAGRTAADRKKSIEAVTRDVDAAANLVRKQLSTSR